LCKINILNILTTGKKAINAKQKSSAAASPNVVYYQMCSDVSQFTPKSEFQGQMPKINLLYT
jgi:hypothetical protein